MNWLENERVKHVLYNKTYSDDDFHGCLFKMPENIMSELLQVVAEEAVKEAAQNRIDSGLVRWKEMEKRHKK